MSDPDEMNADPQPWKIGWSTGGVILGRVD